MHTMHAMHTLHITSWHETLEYQDTREKSRKAQEMIILSFTLKIHLAFCISRIPLQFLINQAILHPLRKEERRNFFRGRRHAMLEIPAVRAANIPRVANLQDGQKHGDFNVWCIHCLCTSTHTSTTSYLLTSKPISKQVKWFGS